MSVRICKYFEVLGIWDLYIICCICNHVFSDDLRLETSEAIFYPSTQ